MIFVTTGTHDQPMDRLVTWLDEWAVQHEERVVVQAMRVGVTCRRVEHVSCLEPERWRALVDQARAVVTHAGPASIFDVQALGKVPIVVPRAAARGEHVDDHQVWYAQTLHHDIPTAFSRSELWEHLDAPPPPCASPDLSALQTEAVRVVERTTRDLVQRSHLGWFRRVLRACCWP